MRLRRLDAAESERGAVAIVVALCVSLLAVVAGMVLDFGLIRVDRQVDQSAADAAALAGAHALNLGDGTPHPFAGVCTAVRYLKRNDVRFASLDESAGWSTTAGATASGCTDTGLRSQTCNPTNQSSWARYDATLTYQGKPLVVAIRSGYSVAGSQWADNKSSATPDTNEECNQIAVVITQSRKPGLGSLATSRDLVTVVRSVGRVTTGPGGAAPAMLLLKRSGCPVLSTGSNGGGSFIHVLGALSSNGLAQPGSIHSDSGSGCSGGSNENIFLGRAGDGIVAYAAPLVSNPSSPDPSKPGSISSALGATGVAGSPIRDALANVHGSSLLNGVGGTATEPTGRGLVTRKLVDDRYFTGVKTALTGASGLFSSLTAANAVSNGWVNLVAVDQCKPTQAEIVAMQTAGTLNSASQLFINCTDNAGFTGGGSLSIPANRVFFNGKLAPGSPLALPNASKVYVRGRSGTGIDLNGSGAQFQMNTSGNLDASGLCTAAQSSSRATLFVYDGVLKEANNALLRLCKTTAFLMGNQGDGCVPSTAGTAPTATPCTGPSMGTGQFTQTGGGIDWTAPDEYDVMTLPNGSPDPAKAGAWANSAGPEDLALWAESGTSNSATYNMQGGSAFHVRGVFMVPNADPFIIGGGASLNLTNAQFIATTVSLNGQSTNITMSVDPNSAITLPKLKVVGLVR